AGMFFAVQVGGDERVWATPPPRRDLPLLRALAVAATWEDARPVPPALPDGPILRPGTAAPTVRALATRLYLEPGLEREPLAPCPILVPRPGVDAPRFGPDLAAHLRAFQLRHGLVPDAVVGTRTRALLDLSPPARAARLRD